MDHAHSKRATVALRKLAENDPALASLSLWCKHRDTAQNVQLELDDGTTVEIGPDIAPAYTDGSTISYGAAFEKFTLSEQKAVCAHEIMHVAFRHVNRARRLRERFGDDFDGYLFNLATDAIINSTLTLAGYQLPEKGVFFPELFKAVFDEEITAEEGIGEYDAEKLYIKLMNEKDRQQQEQQGQQGQQGQAGSDDDQAGDGGDEDGDESGNKDGDGQGDQDGQTGQGGDGKHTPEAARTYAQSKGFTGDMDTRGKPGPEDAQEDSEWQQRLARAMAHGKMAGKGIGEIGHRIADLPKSRTPWELILRRLITKAVTRTPRPSYERPTRRWLGMEADARSRGLAMPAYEPGFVKQSDTPKVAVCVDVSGSISDTVLDIFASEIAAIGNKTGAEIHVLVFDTQVLSETKMEGVDFKNEIKQIEFARGGGTSFVEPVDRARQLDPSIIVVLTDLCGPFGDRPGNIQTIWAVPENERAGKAPFGRVLNLSG